MSEGHFSRLAPGDGLSTAHAASTQISLKFSKPDPTTAAEDIPEHDESEIPFDPRPLHIILGERKAMIDAAFDEYFRLGNRIAKIEDDDADWYNGLDDDKAQKQKRVRDEDREEIEKFRLASKRAYIEEEEARPIAKEKKRDIQREILMKGVVIKKKGAQPTTVMDSTSKSPTNESTNSPSLPKQNDLLPKPTAKSLIIPSSSKKAQTPSLMTLMSTYASSDEDE